MAQKVEIGKVYPDVGGNKMLVLRDVHPTELGARFDKAFDYVEVVFANHPDQSCGLRRKDDGRFPLYAHWPQHPCHLIVGD